MNILKGMMHHTTGTSLKIITSRFHYGVKKETIVLR